jgi:hypothetical protein
MGLKKAREVGKVDVEVVGTDVKTYRSTSLREGTGGRNHLRDG